VDRVVTREDRLRLLRAPVVQERRPPRERVGLRVVPDTEVEDERRPARPGLRDGSPGCRRLAARLQPGDRDRPRNRKHCGGRDVREPDEWDDGHIPSAVHVQRGNLESRIANAATDHGHPIVVYCAGGSRSAFAAKTLEELGYEHVTSLAGGYTDWKRNGFPTKLPKALSPEQRRRYSRHLLIPEVGEAGQLKLLESRILLIGA